ncbi:uncharacterized protein LAESUDRAFT_676040 [Laetiporus sulphureus 93-53]|uniref:Lethal giant larvae (Lgl)-like C-terminal domain-containing protein n=1 Tax=Laetiporus sulphureus 93-53 TaxID=1314785 RepID=A0A165FAS2_9APHY|nr:uncharacterized protein LAESUDRAFT_676040 [Laetiporus sulphureus 93-53]KZT08686.1 hypothetical protein LAESUDRAFT_676040 [Laetiporus sulphureus 93-53]
MLAVGVECTLSVSDPPGTRAKILSFASSLFKLLCVDNRDRLHIWDLSALGRPKLQRIVNFSHPVNCIAASPSHAQILVALANGQIKTYDLLCLRMSPYTIPSNLWQQYEDTVHASGMPAIPAPASDMIVDIAVHPRNLNLLFIAFGGGVILSDLTQRNTVRAYELILPPGAPGGSGYNAPDILLPRRPSVTTLAVHPSGHILAIGYADGSLAFWALEDEDRPLLVRTVDNEEDVGIVDVPKLEAALPSHNPATGYPEHPSEIREAIFKLTWSGFPNSSDPRGGDTVLTVLGGLAQDADPGVTAFLLPPLNPPASPALSPAAAKAPAPPAMHPDVRAAIVASLSALDSHTYSTAGAVQDFILVPRSSPHFAGTWDPHAILVVSDSDLDSAGATRIVQAFDFPPPSFVEELTGSSASNADVKSIEDDDRMDALSQELASTLQSISLSADPRLLCLPWPFWAVTGSVICGIDRGAYEQIVRENDYTDLLPLRGGRAWVEDTEGEMKLMKFQPRRILITHDPDLVLRFQDLSAQLLVSSLDNPFKTSFPGYLPALTIDIAPLLHDPSLRLFTYTSSAASISSSQSGLEKQSISNPTRPAIDNIYLAPESLECVTTTKNGALVLFRLDNENAECSIESSDDELVSLVHTPVHSGLRYHPFLGIKAGRGQITACAISNVGFLAVTYSSGALLVVDLRGPRVIYRSLPSSKQEHRHSFHGRNPFSDRDSVVSLTWSICPTSSDPVSRVRLIAVVSSGTAFIHTLSHTPSGTWAVSGAPTNGEGAGHAVPGGSVVLDAKTGAQCRADRQGLTTVLAHEDSAAGEEPKQRCVWVSAGAKGARCVADVDGERIARTDWASRAAVLSVEVVEKSGGCVLVAFTERAEALVYSLPYLEHLHSLQLPQSSLSVLSTEPSGDYVTHTIDPASGLARQTDYCTLFATRRMAPYASPLVDLAYDRGTAPPQPAPVSLEPQTVIGSVLGYLGRGVTTGAEIDALLAGPDRPAVPPSSYDAQGKLAPASREWKENQGPSTLQSASATMSSGVGDLYTRLGNALAERGQRLGDLEESFNSLEQGSKGMLAQAKRLAAQQTAKRWFEF